MLVAERQQKIVDLVNERKSIRVTELSNIFSVTEETIRRDLEKLEKEKQLARSHGGAVSIQSKDDIELPYSQREVMNVKEKKEIALEAVKHVEVGDKIILDASTTAWYMAKALPNKPITVLTNSIKVAMELSAKKEITVISTGGVLLPDSLAYVGPLAETALDSYHVNKAFISCKGLHLDRGISESDEQQARIKKQMMDITESVYIMIDHSKFGVQAFSRISGLETIDHIITDSKVDSITVEKIMDRSLNLMKV
ncbi:DeoR/GlpR family DNA-binding transcription regulator [Aquibacillus salsiterrae]|uniref:DeoR/GlpR family DNA-binding transcription regulator n=1 Tax=Aquibacillus salsiterrae TaxID=2950439 RepID=A0A9X3WFH1_9BACI|nr:DeoR/GlpR family DNA-binding transcription regulator [Aquibacillus salsiterrae]MDC3418048.1 DeoR/GlpR family DNA-binding transcription regulator [Aquibacillus salsiterrae]